MKRALLVASGLLCLLMGSVQAQDSLSPSSWSEETLRLARELPVQAGGRIKPLSTYADFQLLRMQGKRTFKTPSGAKLDSTAWMLDCLFRPELAKTYESFRVRNDELVISLGVK
ncbi:MAG: hypothetical protein OSB14_12015, partial [Planctomycetota bacterium]|nr:hypothetical protein [Planctomycetota bacterium]